MIARVSLRIYRQAHGDFDGPPGARMWEWVLEDGSTEWAMYDANDNLMAEGKEAPGAYPEPVRKAGRAQTDGRSADHPPDSLAVRLRQF